MVHVLLFNLFLVDILHSYPALIGVVFYSKQISPTRTSCGFQDKRGQNKGSQKNQKKHPNDNFLKF